MKLTAPVSYEIIEYMLQNPDTSQIDIAKNIGVSKSMVSHITKELTAIGVVSQFGKERMKLEDPLRLLEALSFERPLQRLVFDEFRTEQSDIQLVEQKIRIGAAKLGAVYALTCFSALSKYISYYLAYPTVHVYCNKPKELRRNITEGKGAVNVQVLEPDSRIILKDAVLKNDLTVVKPVQAVIDLFCLGGVGRDGAMKLYEETLNVQSIVS